MFFLLSTEHKKKYKKKRGFDEDLLGFIVKAVGSVSLFVVVAVGLDIYRLLR